MILAAEKFIRLFRLHGLPPSSRTGGYSRTDIAHFQGTAFRDESPGLSRVWGRRLNSGSVRVVRHPPRTLSMSDWRYALVDEAQEIAKPVNCG
jgi:hypothetical protein